MENGTRTDKLLKLADFFKVPCGYLLGQDVLDLSQYNLGDELKKKVIAFLEKLTAAKNPLRLLEAIYVFLDTTEPDSIGTLIAKQGICEEEEILGLWWSIVSAYQRGDWKTMINKSDALINIGEALGRPYLVALGHTYKAKAIRNQGGKEAVEKAEKELKQVLEGERYQSALTCRLIAKIYSRRQQQEKALEECIKAEKLMNQGSRDDALFLLEKVKLLRNIASRNIELARKAKNQNNEPGAAEHLERVENYLKSCRDAIDQLEKQLKEEANVERMLLVFCSARYFEVTGKTNASIKSAKEALELAEKLGQDDYAVRVRMFLCHIYVEQGDKDRAIHYYGSLMPLQDYSSGKFEWQYQRYIGRDEEKIRGYIEEQCRFLTQRIETKQKNKIQQAV